MTRKSDQPVTSIVLVHYKDLDLCLSLMPSLVPYKVACPSALSGMAVWQIQCYGWQAACPCERELPMGVAITVPLEVAEVIGGGGGGGVGGGVDRFLCLTHPALLLYMCAWPPPPKHPQRQLVVACGTLWFSMASHSGLCPHDEYCLPLPDHV